MKKHNLAKSHKKNIFWDSILFSASKNYSSLFELLNFWKVRKCKSLNGAK